MGPEQPLPGLAAVHSAAGVYWMNRGPTGGTPAAQALPSHPPQQTGTQPPPHPVLPRPPVPKPHLPQHQPLQQHHPHFQSHSQHQQQQKAQEPKQEPQKAPAAQLQYTEPEHAVRPEQVRESQQHQGPLPATLQSLQALSQQQVRLGAACEFVAAES